MKIGILGSGDIGGSLGQLWSRAGHQVFYASRHPESLQKLAQRSGEAGVGSVEEAIAFSDTLLDALPFGVSVELTPAKLQGKTLLHASNYYEKRDGHIEMNGLSQSEYLAQRLPETRIIKAFNMMFASEMQARVDADPEREVAIFVAGDEDSGREIAKALIHDAKFVPVDAGALAKGRLFESGGPLYARRLNAAEALAELAATDSTSSS
ncbi:MAG: NAD(P)-binding domain-containing protein [Myxococcota bacterium]